MKLMKNGQHIYYIGSKTGIRVRRPCAFDGQDSFQKSKTGILYLYHFFFYCRGRSKEINHKLKANTFKSIKQQKKIKQELIN